MYWNQLRRIAYAFSSIVLMAGCSWLLHKLSTKHPKLLSGWQRMQQTKETKSVDYTIRVIAAKLIADGVTVRAESEEEALSRVEQRINSKLKLAGYEIQLEILETVNPALLAA